MHDPGPSGHAIKARIMPGIMATGTGHHGTGAHVCRCAHMGSGFLMAAHATDIGHPGRLGERCLIGVWCLIGA